MKFHYSRKERLSMPNAPRLDIRYRKGVFRGNRSLLIVLLDVLLISLMFFLFRNFFFKPENRAELQGYVATLRSRVIKDSIYAAVRIREDDGGGASGRAFVDFRLGDSVRHNSVALEPGEKTTYEVSALLPLESKEQVLFVTVRLGNEAKTFEWNP